MTNAARTLRILTLLAACPWGYSSDPTADNFVGAGTIVELQGRGLIHEPGFEGLWEPTFAGAKVLSGEWTVDDDANVSTWS